MVAPRLALLDVKSFGLGFCFFMLSDSPLLGVKRLIHVLFIFWVSWGSPGRLLGVSQGLEIHSYFMFGVNAGIIKFLGISFRLLPSGATPASRFRSAHMTGMESGVRGTPGWHGRRSTPPVSEGVHISFVFLQKHAANMRGSYPARKGIS